jgi:hypothetical protein
VVSGCIKDDGLFYGGEFIPNASHFGEELPACTRESKGVVVYFIVVEGERDCGFARTSVF